MDKLRNALRFGGILLEHEIDEIVLHFEARQLNMSDDFLCIGKISNEMGFINQGIVRVYGVGINGEEVTKYFFKENQFIVDLESYYNNKPSETALQAVVPTEVFVVKRSVWNKLYDQFPKLFLLTKTISEAQLINKLKDNDFLNFGNATIKYREFINRYPDFALQIPLQYVASYLKITPQSLSRIRKELQKN